MWCVSSEGVASAQTHSVLQHVHMNSWTEGHVCVEGLCRQAISTCKPLGKEEAGLLFLSRKKEVAVNGHGLSSSLGWSLASVFLRGLLCGLDETTLRLPAYPNDMPWCVCRYA